MKYLFAVLALVAPILSSAQIRLSRNQIQAEGVHLLHVRVLDSRILLPENKKLDKSLFVVGEAAIAVSLKDLKRIQLLPRMAQPYSGQISDLQN